MFPWEVRTIPGVRVFRHMGVFIKLLEFFRSNDNAMFWLIVLDLVDLALHPQYSANRYTYQMNCNTTQELVQSIG